MGNRYVRIQAINTRQLTSPVSGSPVRFLWEMPGTHRGMKSLGRSGQPAACFAPVMAFGSGRAVGFERAFFPRRPEVDYRLGHYPRGFFRLCPGRLKWAAG